jgi:hypothetical protein
VGISSGGEGMKPSPQGTPCQTIYSSDLEPVQTRITATPNGPILSLESASFNASLPASPHILRLLAAKLSQVAQA